MTYAYVPQITSASSKENRTFEVQFYVNFKIKKIGERMKYNKNSKIIQIYGNIFSLFLEKTHAL